MKTYILTLLKKIDTILAQISILAIRGYQHTISPDKGLLSFRLKGKVCSHIPHCSEYGAQSLKRY